MARILVVDDDPVQRNLAGRLLEKLPGLDVAYASNGAEALKFIDREPPDLVLTDLVMPEVDGLELVQKARARHASVPVILMTSYGSETVAVEALNKGAASYVSKTNLVRDLREIVAEVLSVAGAERKQRQLLDFLEENESRFTLNNDPTLLSPLIGYLQQNLTRMSLADETRRMRVGIALQEALTNAIYHGNLEVSSELRQGSGKDYYALAEHRRHEPPYRDRKVYLIARETRTEAVYVVRDEGPGFAVDRVADPLDPNNVDKESGRGLFLIRTFMDVVSHNPAGNEITMTLRKPSTGAQQI